MPAHARSCARHPLLSDRRPPTGRASHAFHAVLAHAPSGVLAHAPSGVLAHAPSGVLAGVYNTRA